MKDQTYETANPEGELLIYQADDGKVKLEVRLEDETVWLTQHLMADLFQTSKQNISHHIQSIFEEGELLPEATVKKYLTVRREGNRDVRRDLEYYNLDMIISVGYRVKSLIATRFRIWATQRLKDYVVKGFVMDDERLKNPPVKGSAVPDYFDEMLSRIRDIRASERRMYLRVKEIFTMAADYEPTWGETTRFFSVIQNKLHFAATGMTAAEDQAKRRKQVFMKEWEQKLDEFLRFNDRRVLPDAGKVSKENAEVHARTEYEKFEVRRREFKESMAEVDYVKQLEEAARQLPVPKKREPDEV